MHISNKLKDNMTQTLQHVNKKQKINYPATGVNLSIYSYPHLVISNMGQWLASDTLVFYAIKQACNGRDVEVSTSVIEQATGLSRPTVISSRRRLRDFGALAWTTRHEICRYYDITHFKYTINPVFCRKEIAQSLDDYFWDITCKIRQLGKKATHRKKSHLIWPLPDLGNLHRVSFTRYSKTIGSNIFNNKRAPLMLTKSRMNIQAPRTIARLFTQDLKRGCVCSPHLDRDNLFAQRFCSSCFQERNTVTKHVQKLPCISTRSFKPPLLLLQKKLGITNKGLAYLSIYPSDVIDQALTSSLRANGNLNNAYSYISRAAQKIAASMSYTITNENLLELRRLYDIPEEMPFNEPNFKQKQQLQQEKEIDYRPDFDRDKEAADLIEKLRAMEPAEAAIILHNAKQAGLLTLAVDEWPEDLQRYINAV